MVDPLREESNQAAFSERMIESDRAGNVRGMPNTTYHRARVVWAARLSSDPVLAARAQAMIEQLDRDVITLGGAARLLGLETPSQGKSRPSARPGCVATVRRIVATLDGLTQAAAGIGDLSVVGLVESEAADLADRIALANRELSKIIKQLRSVR
jgi:hypothetical protein